MRVASTGTTFDLLATPTPTQRRVFELLGASLVFAVDASTWARCDAECSPGGFHYSAAHHSAGQPIVSGWSYQWISQLNWSKDSRTAPADVVRLNPKMSATEATIDQVRRLVGLLPADREVPLFVFDAGYDGTALAKELKDERCEVLVRISSSRVFHHDPVVREDGARGRPAPAREALPALRQQPGRHPTTTSCSRIRPMERCAPHPARTAPETAWPGYHSLDRCATNMARSASSLPLAAHGGARRSLRGSGPDIRPRRRGGRRRGTGSCRRRSRR